MKDSRENVSKESRCDDDTRVGTEEKALIVMPVKVKRHEDETISSRGRYVSRFHYSTRNIDKYIELCPHCKKPTMSAFHRTVMDNAIDYLEGRRVLRHYPGNQSRLLKYSTGLVAVGAAVVFLLLPLIFGGNV